MITQAELKARILYNPETGEFQWVQGGRFNRLAGKPAGYTDPDGYIQIRIDKKLYQAHRLAWLYMTGEWPPSGFVDHVSTVVTDNRWVNLRDATKKINQENRRRAGRNNKAGLLGVSPNGKRWAATINTTENGERKHHYLGTFDTPDQAHQAYVEAKRKHHKGCTL